MIYLFHLFIIYFYIFSFIGRDKGLLLDIHEEMMFDIPSTLEKLQKERNKEGSGDEDCSSPQRSIQMPSSFGEMSETSSVCSQNQQRYSQFDLKIYLRIFISIFQNTSFINNLHYDKNVVDKLLMIMIINGLVNLMKLKKNFRNS